MVCCICFPYSEKKRVHHPNVFSKLKKPQRFSLLYAVSSKTRRVWFVKSAVFFRNSLLKTQQEYRIYNPQKIPEKMIATTFKSWYNEIQTGYNAGFFDKNSQKISTCLLNLFTESAAHAAFRNGQATVHFTKVRTLFLFFCRRSVGQFHFLPTDPALFYIYQYPGGCQK